MTTLLPRVRTRTLVLHGRDDAIAPLSEGRFLASNIPGAQFVELDSLTDALLSEETLDQDAAYEAAGLSANRTVTDSNPSPVSSPSSI